MRFTLTISLDNAEVEDAGIDIALPAYLAQVAERCESGHADAGIVRDGNGNTIGQYLIWEDSAQYVTLTRAVDGHVAVESDVRTFEGKVLLVSQGLAEMTDAEMAKLGTPR